MARHSTHSLSINEDYERVLRPLRLILSAAVVGLVVLEQVTGNTAVGDDLLVIALVLALGNVVWNLVARSRGRSAVAVGIQALFDAFLALTAVAIIDGNSSPLVWLLLMLPVIGVAARYGMVGALFTWLGVSGAYLLLLLNTPTTTADETGVLRLGVEQSLAVVAVAVPTVILGNRIRQTLDGTRRALDLADKTRRQLLLTSRAAQQMGAATNSERVLELALETMLSLGYDRADVAESSGGRWRMLAAAGNGGQVPATALNLLDRATAARETGADGPVEAETADRQALHDLGYEHAVALVVSDGTIDIGVRAFVDERSFVRPEALEAVRTLAEHLLGALGNTMTTARLTSWASQLEHRANHDELTGLPNRAHLLATLAADAGTDSAVLFMDLNGFKQVNDDHGHEAGDAVLRVVAKRLRSVVDDGGFAARLGGDEFVVFSTDRSRAELADLAERIGTTIAEPIVVTGRTFTVGASIGIAEAEPGIAAAELLRNADQAMYEAKVVAHRTGTSQHRFGTPDKGAVDRRVRTDG